MNRDTFFSAAKKHGVEDIAKIIWDLRQPATQIQLQGGMTDNDIPVGASKFGGLPDLSPETEYPHHHSQPLLFIGQINCEDVATFAATKFLPQAGLLSFFYNEYQFLENDAHMPTHCQVIYSHHIETLTRTPDSQSERLFECASLKFSEVTSLPFQTSLLISDSINQLTVTMNDNDREEFYTFMETVFIDVNDHRMFGHPNSIQEDAFLDAYNFARGGTWSNLGYEVTRENQEKWNLLLQVDSSDVTGMMWGDMGRLYYCIREDDLKNLGFDKVVCTMQCS